MPLAPTLQKHLDQNVTYEVITHDPTMSSTRTAQACHVSGDRFAKAIVLRRDGGYMLAVLPASHHIRLPELRQHIGDDVALADESEIKRLFPDCALGAVPAIGECYDLAVIVDDSIQEQPESRGRRSHDAHSHQPGAILAADGGRAARPLQRPRLSRAVAARLLPGRDGRSRCAPDRADLSRNSK